MAIDTRNKRSSAIHVGLPWRGLLPVPDTVIAFEDEIAVADFYSDVHPLPMFAEIAVPFNLFRRTESLELWTDREDTGGIRLAVLSMLLSLEESADLPGEHSLTFSVPLWHPATRMVDTPADKPNFRVGQITRFIKPDSTWTQHRIDESTKRVNSGAEIREVTAVSIMYDLAARGLVSRTYANGTSTAMFPAMGLTMEEQLREFILPALVGAGEGTWDVGVLSHSNPVDMQYNADVPLAAIKKLAERAGNLEYEIVGTSQGYEINIVQQVGQGKAAYRVAADYNLIDMMYTERGGDQATRVYAFGGEGEGGARATIGQAEWEVWGAFNVAGGRVDVEVYDPAGGAAPVKFPGQFAPYSEFTGGDDDEEQADPQLDRRFYLHVTTGGAPWTRQILSSRIGFLRDTGTGKVNTSIFQVPGPMSPMDGFSVYHGLPRVKIVSDEQLRENLYVEYPEQVLDYHVLSATIDRSDIPLTNNLVRNGLGRQWSSTSSLPVGWTRGTGDFGTHFTVTRELDRKYWEHGGQAARVKWNDLGWPLYSSEAIISPDYHGPLSFFVRLTVLSGAVRVGAFTERSPKMPDGSPSPSLPWKSGTGYIYNFPFAAGQLVGEEDLPDIVNSKIGEPEDLGFPSYWDTSQYDLYGGSVHVSVAPVVVGTEVVISGFQVTQSAGQLPLLEGSGGTRLHQLANQELGIYGKPARVVNANVIEMAAAAGEIFPYEKIVLGGAVYLNHPRSETSVKVRVTGWSRDWFNRTMPRVTLAQVRPAVTRLISAQDWGTRAVPIPTALPIRGLTFTSGTDVG